MIWNNKTHVEYQKSQQKYKKKPKADNLLAWKLFHRRFSYCSACTVTKNKKKFNLKGENFVEKKKKLNFPI